MSDLIKRPEPPLIAFVIALCALTTLRALPYCKKLDAVKNVSKLLPLGLPNSLTKSSSEDTAVISPTGPFSKAPAIAPIDVDTAGTTLVKSTSLTRTPGAVSYTHLTLPTNREV